MPDVRMLESRRGADVLHWIAAELGKELIPTARVDAEFILAETLGLAPAAVRSGAADAALLTVDELDRVLGAMARIMAPRRS